MAIRGPLQQESRGVEDGGVRDYILEMIEELKALAEDAGQRDMESILSLTRQAMRLSDSRLR